MISRPRIFACFVILFLIIYVVLPWVVPVYNHNLVLSITRSAGNVPTYDVLLENAAPWPVTLVDAQWRVTHYGLYNYWVPSEAPIQNLTLLPFQSHSFQFTIYRGSATSVSEYFNGTLTVFLNATITVFGATQPFHFTAYYNAT